jgi:hypothetical protein
MNDRDSEEMDELTRLERNYMHYIAERLAKCRAYLLRDSSSLSLQERLGRALAEGFSATLTDWFAEAHADLREEWEGIRDDATRFGRYETTLAELTDEELETLEARVLTFVQRYLDRTEPGWSEDEATDDQ